MVPLTDHVHYNGDDDAEVDDDVDDPEVDDDVDDA